MIQIIVLDHMNPNEDQPVARFLNGLAGLVGNQFVALPATFIEFQDPHLADHVTRILSQAGELYYMLPEETPVEPESAQLDCANEQIEAAIKAIREKAESLAGQLDETETIVAVEPVYAWREKAELAEEDPAVVINPGDPERGVSELPDAFISADQAESLGRQYDGAAAEPKPAKKTTNKGVGRGRGPRKVAERRQPCVHCGEVFISHRKDQIYCDKDACRKAKEAVYNKRYFEKRQAAKGQAVEERPVSAIDGLPVPHPSDPDPTQPKKNGRMWLIEDGKQAGQMISESELRKELELGYLVAGQHVSNNRHGKCRVIQFKGKHPRLAVKQLFGEGADRIIDLAAQ